MKIRGCTQQKWEPVQAVLQICSFSQPAFTSLHSPLSARHHAKDCEFSYQTHSISLLMLLSREAIKQNSCFVIRQFNVLIEKYKWNQTSKKAALPLLPRAEEGFGTEPQGLWSWQAANRKKAIEGKSKSNERTGHLPPCLEVILTGGMKHGILTEEDRRQS